MAFNKTRPLHGMKHYLDREYQEIGCEVMIARPEDRVSVHRQLRIAGPGFRHYPVSAMRAAKRLMWWAPVPPLLFYNLFRPKYSTLKAKFGF